LRSTRPGKRLLLALLVCMSSSLGARLPVHAARAAPRPLVYAAIGASETVGVGADHPATESWVADLVRKLPRGSRLVNLGKSGALLSYGVSHELPAAIASHPAIVTVWMAVNDINGRVPPPVYRRELDSLLGGLEHHTHAAVYVGNVPDLRLMPLYAGLDKTALLAVVDSYNSVIAATARAHHDTVVDIFTQSQRTLPSHPEYLSEDGFHPSTRGYASLAQLWWSVIRTRPPVAH
jgi:acyl-CoA thioesterase I